MGQLTEPSGRARPRIMVVWLIVNRLTVNTIQPGCSQWRSSPKLLGGADLSSLVAQGRRHTPICS